MKIGIEIHQRLATKKLFCGCSSEISEDAAACHVIERRLHPVLSELGEADRASQAESSKERVFEYHVFHNNCLVETDEEPPAPLNPEALKIALQAALQLHATPLNEVHVMRKTVIDGSNTAGFQRTAIIAMNGQVGTSRGSVAIPLIAIEEESAGILSAGEGRAAYRLDRLGIPLIEISTTPDIKDGAHLAEVAQKLGMMLRTLPGVARGLGTIRQDVNISTEGGARVEIKGAQDLKMLPKYVDNEEQRQLELVKLLAELRSRKALPVKKHGVDVTEIFRDTRAPLIAAGMKAGSVVLAQKLTAHEGLLGRELQHGKRYGTELSDYAKLAGVKGIIHSDEALEKYGMTKDELAKLANALSMANCMEHGKEPGAAVGDAFVLIVAPKAQAERAMGHVVGRANMDYVPQETRRANPDGTSSFMRPLPGRARLYPETDVPPIMLTKDVLDAVERTESLERKMEKLEKLLNREMAGRVLKSRHLHLFERLVAGGADPMLAAVTLEDTVVSLRREGVEFADLEKALAELFSEFNKGTFVKAAIPEVLKAMAKGARVEAVLKVFRFQRITGKELEKLAEECNHDMKAIMQKYRLQVDPQEVSLLLALKKKTKETSQN